jgi:glutathione S-transferase
MELYFSNQCGNSKRVLFTLAELGVEVDRHALDLRRREHKSAAYLALNPLGKVPALVDGGLVLWESNAIALYLAEKFPDRRLVPASIEGRAELHKWLFYLAYEIAVPAWRYFFNARGFQLMGGVADQDELAAAARSLETALAPLEARLAGRRHLLEEFSLADIAYAPSFASLAAAGWSLAAWPNVQTWTAALLARPAWRKAAGA